MASLLHMWKYASFVLLLLSLFAMQSLQSYTVVLLPDDNGTFVAYVPAIAGCHAWGQTIDEAQAELIQVFEMIREEYQKAGQELPEDVELAVTHAR
jgi:predicted RNase H-like HicB family nuclease